VYTFILQHSVCGAFAITILAIYAVRIAREWREYHPKQVTENTGHPQLKPGIRVRRASRDGTRYARASLQDDYNLLVWQ